MCLFCKIVAGEIPAQKILEDELCVAIRDINPQAPTHAVVIPRKHIETLNDLTAQDDLLAGRLLRMGVQVARHDGIAERGFRLVFNTHLEAGQSVFHIHLHVLGGRPMQWPPG